MRAGAQLIAAVAVAALVAGCSGKPRPSARALKQIDRALQSAPGEAQPSKIVKAELAFNRAAREEGQWTAFAKFAAPDAVIHTPGGLANLSAFLQGRKDPEQAVQWEPKSVWMSCDGSTAVSQGRLRDAAGKVGTYITVWERQRDIQPDGEDETGYRFVYDTAAFDDPQPPVKPAPEALEGGIVVEAIDAVRAEIADCPKPGSMPQPSFSHTIEGEVASAKGYTSKDGTLHWGWLQRPDNNRTVTISLFQNGEWKRSHSQDLPSAPN